MSKVKITEVCDFQGGTQPPKSVWIKEPQEGYIRMLQIRDFTQPEKDNIEYVPVKSSLKTCESDDILIGRYGASVGKILRGLSGAYNVAMVKTIPNETYLDKNYLWLILNSQRFQNFILNVGSRAAQAGFNKSDLEGFTFNLPPLSEQKTLAEILNIADSYQQKTKDLIKRYDQLAHSIFLDMFGDPIQNPMKWSVEKLKHLTNKILSGNTPKGGSKVYVKQGITFFRSQNVWRNRIELEDVVFLDEETHNKMRKTSLKYGDLLMTKTGRINTEKSSLGRAAMYTGQDDCANINGHVYLIRINQNVNKAFILYILTTKSYREHIRRVCVGGIDKRQINKSHIEDFPIISPPRELQDKFTDILLSIEKQKKKSQKILEEASELYKSLQQKAFKGELIN